MDEIVLKSMARWPNVPQVFGWLSLDQRGNWLIKEQRISNPVITEFIGRNYHVDEQGRWFFQNGPQRVFVTLAYAPYVLWTRGSEADACLETHTGVELETITGAWIDENGTVILRGSSGVVGSVSDRDLGEIATWLTNATGQVVSDEMLAKAIESRTAHGSMGIWLSYRADRLPVGRVKSDQVPRKFGFDRSPQPAPGDPDC